MKYFTNKLWRKMNALGEAERESANAEWNANSKAYLEYIHKIAPMLSRGTRNAICEIAEGELSLHDFILAGVSYSSMPPAKRAGRSRQPYKRVCRLQLTDGVTNVELVMSGVSRMGMEMEYEKENDFFDVRWGYCEFSYHKPNVTMSVLFDSGHIWEFTFLSLAVNKSHM